MKASNLQSRDPQPLRLAGPGPHPSVGQAVRLIRDSTHDDEVELRWDGGTWSGRVGLLTPELRFALNRLNQSLGVIAHRQDEGLIVTVHRFVGVVPMTTPLRIGVTEEAAEKLAKSKAIRSPGQGGATPAWACQILNEQVTIHGLDRPVSLIGIPRGKEEALTRGFRLGGDTVHVQVQVDKDGCATVQQLPRTRGSKLKGVHLLMVEVEFVVDSEAARLREEVVAQLSQLEQDASSYQRIWGRYLDAEYDLLAQRLEAAGWLRYSRKQRRADGSFLLTVDVTESFPKDGAALRARLPAALQDGSVALAADLHKAVAQPARLRHGHAERAALESKASQHINGTFCHWHKDGKRVVVEIEDEDDAYDVPAEGYLHAPLLGDLPRLKRRADAQQAIMEGNTPMPKLALLLEGQQIDAIARAPKRIAHARWLELFDGDNPTEAQREAVIAAVFTPEVAVIQGPPGTGKTKVIAAIVHLLDELEARGAESDARVLVTSTQHDAVNNAAVRLTLRGVPAVKVGRSTDERALIEWRDDWLHELRDNRRRMPDPPSTVAAARLDLRVCMRVGLPAKELLHRVVTVLDQARPHVPADLAQAARAAIRAACESAPMSPPAEEAKLRRAVFALTDNPMAFADGGNEQAHRAHRALKRHAQRLPLADEETALLTRLADFDVGAMPSPEELAAVGVLRDRLLLPLRPQRSVQLIQRLEGAALHTMANVLDAWQRSEGRRHKSKAAVLQALIDDIETDSEAVEDMLLGYTTTLAATCQHAASRRMHQARRGDESRPIRFDTVIVDEAARVDPLDLQIPLAQASRRIVLVGDHRQLPHMLEPEIHEGLTESVEELERLALEESLFQRLIRNARALEKKDGKRRVVVLDAQFRSHPKLGDLISRHFYERAHGEGDPGIVLQSGLDAGFTGFKHKLSDYSDAAGQPLQGVWIHVPAAEGKERRQDKSLLRTAEAKRVATELLKVLRSSSELSVGVISFYRAQVNEIWRALRDAGQASYDLEEDRWQLDESLSLTADGAARHVRIGTVDAFQGLEFDVVFLSFTRCNQRPVEGPETWHRRYGHLLSRHRRCVALSRQKRLLIVVGDAAMVSATLGKEALPDLHDFHSKCKEADDGFARQS